MNTETKTKRTRSPAYPAVDLEEAISKATALWTKVNRHSAPLDAVVGFWGYDKKSSAGYSVASALIKFGLLTDAGTRASRSVQLTPSAIKLTYEPNPSDPEYIRELKEAALRPKIHLELWERYSGNLPDDAVIRRYLVVDRKFHEVYVDAFITEFRNTIEFAKLCPSDTVSQQQHSLLETMPKVHHEVGQFVHPKPATEPSDTWASRPMEALPSRELALPLESGRFVRLPLPMSEDDYSLLLETLKLWKKRLVQTTDEKSLSEGK